jgi:hypothetical protein
MFSTTLNLESEEIYLGGITSANVIESGFPGNGIHVTNKRLILVRSRFPMASFLFGSVIMGSERSGKASGSGARAKLRQLEKRKYFEVYKENLLSIELRKPNQQKWSMIRIVPKFADPLDVGINSIADFEYAKNLMISFYPEAIKLV